MLKIRFAKEPQGNAALNRPADIELIRQLVRDGTENTKLPAELWVDPKNAFISRPAGEWLDLAAREQPPRPLFGGLWTEGELCILFADTNAGKSILAVQIGNSITRGQSISSFEMKVPPEPVLYFDFELSMQQFRQRYSEPGGKPFPFSPLFRRVVLNPECTSASRFKNYNEFIANGLENTIISSGARIVIVDHLSCLRSGTEGTTAAVELMRHFKTLKTRHKLSLLVLAHTPKRNAARPITRNDLQGSKMLINFADSAFAIGLSQTQPGLRYLKQVKQRSGAEHYGADNVCLCRLNQTSDFLYFDFTGHSTEHEHLLAYTEQQRRQREQTILELHRQNLSLRQIATRLNIAGSTVLRALKRMEENTDDVTACLLSVQS